MRKRFVLLGKVIIGVGLLLFLVFYLNPDRIVKTFAEADKPFLLIAVFILPLNLVAQFYKWKLLSSEYFGIRNNNKIWLSLFYGISGGIFTPMKSGEYFARALPYSDVKILDVILATLVDKILPILFVFLIGGIFFVIYLKMIFDFSLLLTVIIIIVYKIIFFSVLYLLVGNSSLSEKVKKLTFVQKYLGKIFERIAFLKKIRPKVLAKVFTISLLYHLTFTIQMTLLLVAFSGTQQFFLFFFAANLIIFAQIIIPPVALGEVGVREGAAVYFLQNLGLPGTVGFNSAISLFFINLLLPSVVGFFLLLRRN